MRDSAAASMREAEEQVASAAAAAQGAEERAAMAEKAAEQLWYARLCLWQNADCMPSCLCDKVTSA